MDLTDKPKPIREGEELDVKSLEGFLKDNLPGLEGDLVLKQFPGGHSNLTYMLSLGDRDFVLRRPPHGVKAKTAHDMSREYRIQKALRPLYRYTPEVYLYTEDESVIGCPFYVMERIKGIIPRKNFPPELNLTEDQVRKIFTRLLEVHVELHQVDYVRAGLENFGKPEGYVKRQVEGWSKRYRNARTPDSPDCEKVMAWLLEKMPPDCPKPGIIHNDFRLDNAVLDPENPEEIIGVLDWEMATLGDPLMDLGGSLAYWIQPGDPQELQTMRMMPSDAPGALTREEIVEMYGRLSGLSMTDYDFYYCFGLFRLGVIAQQIYYRFYHGQTKDERFKKMIFGVHILDQQAQRVIEASDL